MSRHFSGTLARMVLDHFRDHGVDGAVEELLGRAGETRPVEVLTEDSCWSSYDQFRRLLEAAAVMLGGADRLVVIGKEAAIAAGSMPETIEAMQALGSPAALFEQIGAGQAGIVNIMESQTEQRGPTEWLIKSRFDAGFAPFAEFCAFAQGLATLAPGLFGFRNVDVVEETCERGGDHWCTVAVRWDATDEMARQVSYLTTRTQLLEMRLESFQRTVAELVSAEDLETVLSRVVAAAARAVRAPGFVLALEPLPWPTARVYCEGIDQADADAIAATVLALDTPEAMIGGLAADVASTRRRYGRLVALDPHGSVMAHERVLLEAYARLAATALDSATALEEARRQSDTARTLLRLSTALAEVVTTDEMAAIIAHAIPSVIDCDRAVVAIANQDAASARVIAVHGFSPNGEAALVGTDVPFAPDTADALHYVDPGNASPNGRALMDASGVVAMVVVPVAIDRTKSGWLVVAVADRPERLARSSDLDERLRGLAAHASTALTNAGLVEQIHRQALHDSLTGLPNRTLILDRVEHMLHRARRHRTGGAALYIDLDGFKDINDRLGHEAGDLLLRAVAARLASAARDTDTVGRLGGDEFVVLTETQPAELQPTLVAERLLAVLREPYVLAGTEGATVELTASIGIATGDRSSAGELLRDADLALYRAKAAGKDCYVVYAPEMQATFLDRLALERDLRDALSRHEFTLLYQPIFDLATNEVTGVEALLRWNHPTRGLIMPDEFIPMLEKSGLIVDVGRWVLEHACRQGAQWHQRGHDIGISVNVSAVQLERPQLVDDVKSALVDTGLTASSLTLEITETAIMRNAELAVRILHAIKTLGVRIAIDDFGTGYSSLNYLKQFPVDAIKIDQAFVSDIANSHEAAALMHTLVQLGKTLGLTTLAEGIEHDDQFAHLRREDCDSGQGFLFSRPLDATALETFLTTRSQSPTPA
ncbi:MAG TPA: bifunctional diguanylate cyclase/phosphodiesterase [Acidimicrobiales bacterium]|nr:bifunctional diguanylate cyclase/phosphodiesterase [Acidimicrobiales bacterium]